MGVIRWNIIIIQNLTPELRRPGLPLTVVLQNTEKYPKLRLVYTFPRKEQAPQEMLKVESIGSCLQNTKPLANVSQDDIREEIVFLLFGN